MKDKIENIAFFYKSAAKVHFYYSILQCLFIFFKNKTVFDRKHTVLYTHRYHSAVPRDLQRQFKTAAELAERRHNGIKNGRFVVNHTNIVQACEVLARSRFYVAREVVAIHERHTVKQVNFVAFLQAADKRHRLINATAARSRLRLIYRKHDKKVVNDLACCCEVAAVRCPFAYKSVS